MALDITGAEGQAEQARQKLERAQQQCREAIVALKAASDSLAALPTDYAELITLVNGAGFDSTPYGALLKSKVSAIAAKYGPINTQANSVLAYVTANVTAF